MISLEQCRKIDPKLDNLSDEKLTHIRDLLYEFGYLAMETYIEDKSGSKNIEFPRGVNGSRPTDEGMKE